MFSTSFVSLALVAGVSLMAGCSTPLRSADDFLGLITPYRIDIVQGNVVTKEQVALVKPGLSRSQVVTCSARRC